VNYKFKKKIFCTEMVFWRRAARTSRLPKVRSEVIREKMGASQAMVGRLENDRFK